MTAHRMSDATLADFDAVIAWKCEVCGTWIRDSRGAYEDCPGALREDTSMTREPTWTEARWELMAAALEFDEMNGDSLERLVQAAHSFREAFTRRAGAE